MSKESIQTDGKDASEFTVKTERKIESIKYITFKKYPGQIMLFGINIDTLEKAQAFTEENIENVLSPLQLKGVRAGFTVCVDLTYDPKRFEGIGDGDWGRGTY